MNEPLHDLRSRIHVLEEQLREMDQRSDEKLADEQKRNRELLARMEREKQLEIENYSIRYVCFKRQSHFPERSNSCRKISMINGRWPVSKICF